MLTAASMMRRPATINVRQRLDHHFADVADRRADNSGSETIRK